MIRTKTHHHVVYIPQVRNTAVERIVTVVGDTPHDKCVTHVSDTFPICIVSRQDRQNKASNTIKQQPATARVGKSSQNVKLKSAEVTTWSSPSLLVVSTLAEVTSCVCFEGAAFGLTPDTSVAPFPVWEALHAILMLIAGFSPKYD